MRKCICPLWGRSIAFLFLGGGLVVPGFAQLPAFPGAEGFGAYATGGRGGDVYYVMNLNPSGVGSFADAIATAPASGRTIVFGVSGYIPVNKFNLNKRKITIAGQTAPGDGIGFKGGSFIINGSDVVIRHARFRYGKQTAGGDCINIGNGVTNLMLDHISMAFSTDENISSFSQNPRPDLFTFQWSLNAWGLESHSCGGLWDLNRVTTHHTLWAHHHTRNPKARPDGLLDWLNNVTYDWDIGFILGDSTTPATWKANVLGNYFICPPGNLRSVALEKASLDRNGNYNFTLHVGNNLFDKNGNTVLDGSDYGYGIASGSYQVSNAPIVVAGAQVPVAIDPPLTAYKKIVSRAGPLRLNALSGIPLRDEVDTILISNLVTLKRNHVSHENQTGASNNGMGFLNSATAPVDTDRDGMPDYWENTLGWNAGGQDHNTALPGAGGFVTGLTFFPPNTPAGYTRLEEYLHFLAIPHAIVPRNTAANPSSFSVDLRRYVSGFNKAPATFTFSSVTNGTVGLQPDGYTAVFTPTLDYAGRARFNFTVTDGDGSTWTQTFGVLVSSATLPRNLKWKGDGSANLWNTNAPNFLDGTNLTAFVPGDNVRFDDTGFHAPAVTVNTALMPGVMEVDAASNYTFAGTGSLDGAMSLVKDGPGTLVLGTANSYGGGTTLRGGLLVLSNSTAAAGSGGITLEGGNLALTAPGGPAVYNHPLVVNAPATIFTYGSGNNNQALGGAITGSEPLYFNIASGATFSPRSGMSLAGYTGTITLTGPGFFRWQGGTGSSSTAFDLGSHGIMLTRDGGTITLGSLTGGAASTLRGAGSTANATTYVIGQKGGSTFDGSILNGLVSGNPVATAITKLGPATLTLTGTNSHTGNTQVGAGTLRILGHNGPSPVIISNNATLAGTGVLGGLTTVNSGGRLAPGSDGPGTLTFTGGLTLNTPTLQFDLASTPAGNSDKLLLQGGVLAMTGAQTYQFTLLGGQLNAGTYTLIEGGDNTSASGVSLVHNLPADARQTFALQRPAAGNGQCYVRLAVTGDPATLVWRGLANNVWDLTTTNWLNGATPERFYNFDTVVFDDTGAAVPVVHLPAAVNPASVTVSAATARTFTGPGALTGSGLLTKSGAGTLTLNTTNSSFSGHVAITGGAITLGTGASLNTGNLTLGGGGTFNFPPSSPAYFYGGTITVSAGQSGTLYSPGLGNGINGNLISGDSNSVLYISSGVSFGGTTSSQFDGFHGTIHLLPGSTLRFSANSSGNTFGSLNPTFVINGALRPRNAGNTIRLGALSGAGSIEGPQSNAGSGDTTYLIGGNHLDVTFSGNISSNSAVPGSQVVLHKIGTGKLTLHGASTFTGGTTVEAGSLIVNNPAGSGTGTGEVFIQAGATLGGTGFIGSPTVLEDYARLSPGDNGAGTLTFNHDLDLGEFCELDFELGAASDRIVANAAVTLRGVLNVFPGTGFGAGTYTLLTYNPAQTFNFSGLTLGSAPAGYDYALNTATPGQVKLVVSQPTPPGFGGISVSGGNVILSGGGGPPGANYVVLGATNVTLPIAQWSRLVTNQFDGNGNFAWTNPAVPGVPRQFFRLQVP